MNNNTSSQNLTLAELQKTLKTLPATLKDAYDFLVEKKASEKEQSCALRAIQHLLQLDPDLDTLQATVLFQIPDITTEDLSDIKQKFGPHIQSLVKDLMKFSRINFEINTSEKRQTFIKKAVLVLSKDYRALYAKLATRLAKLEVRKEMYNANLKQIAEETLDIHVPIANLLGLWEIHTQLGDIAFEIINPQEYQRLLLFRSNKLHLNNEHIEKMRSTLINVANTAEIPHTIEIQEKSIYEIFTKQQKKFNANSLKDVMAFKVVVTNKRDCYRILGLIHSLWKPQSQSFKDFISIPKLNGYQALHTTVFGPSERTCLFQITTPDLIKQQQASIKNNQREFTNKTAYEWLKSNVDESSMQRDTEELMKDIKNNTLERNILIFTSKGKIINLPKYSTCIDAAYSMSVHTGNHYLQAIVNQTKVPPFYNLQTGDTVEITTSPNAPGPKLEWLNYINTEKAKHSIQNFLKKLPLEDQKLSGKYELEKNIKQLFSHSWKNQEKIIEKRLNEKLQIPDMSTLFENIGRGEMNVKKIITKIFEERELNKINNEAHALTKLDIQCLNKVGMLKNITDKIVATDLNIEKVFTKPHTTRKTSTVSILLYIDSFEKLYHVVQKIEQTPGVISVEREA